MGIIRAVASSVSDVAGEQWKEFFYCNSLPEEILLVRGLKHISEHSSNDRQDDGVITNGSIIAVADGQGALAVSQGKVIAYYTEPGEHIFEDPEHPGGVKGFLKETGHRISFGGGVQTIQQRIYYFNTKEIRGIPFSGQVPVTLQSGELASRLFLSGVFSYRVCDPPVFYKMVTGNVATQYGRSRLNSQLVSEVLTALSEAVAKTGLFSPSDIGLHTDDLITELRATVNDLWKAKRGLEILQIGFDQTGFSAAGAVENLAVTGVYAGSGSRQGSAPAAEQPTETSQPAAKMQPASDKWICSCKAENTGNFCRECGAAKPVKWVCSCGAENSGNFCMECGMARTEKWTCSCGTQNTGNFCMECGKAKNS